MGDIRSLNAKRADQQQDNTLLSPAELLEEAAREIRSGETPCDSVLVLRLDRGVGGDCYNAGWNAANLKASEMLALMEVAKAVLLAEMGYIDR